MAKSTGMVSTKWKNRGIAFGLGLLAWMVADYSVRKSQTANKVLRPLG